MGQVGQGAAAEPAVETGISGNDGLSPGIVFRKITRPDGRMAFTHINAAIFDICGLEPADVIADASRFFDAVHPDDRERFDAAISRANARGTACELELRILTVDGDFRWMHGSCSPERTADGETIWDGILVDITERKARADRDKAMVEAIPIPAAITRLSDGAILYANDLYADLFDVGIHSVVGRKATDLYLSPEHRQEMLYALNQHGRLHGYELELTRAGGAAMWVVISARLMEFNGEPAIFGSLYDITKSKRAELEARESGKRFRNLVEGSLQGVWVFHDRKPVFANQAFADILGYESPEEILREKSVSFFVHPEERNRLDGYQAARFRGDPAPTNYEFRAVRKDESVVWLNARPVRVEWDDEPAIQTTYYDVTDQRNAQEALRESERRFQDYSEAGSDWFWETDARHRFSSFTTGGFSPPSVDPRTLIGKTRQQLAGEAEVAANPEMWRAYETCLAQQRPFRELRYKAMQPDGSYFWLRVSGVPVFDDNGAFAGYRGTSTNITAQVEAEERANAAQRSLAAAIDGLSAWVAMFDADDRLVLANRAWWSAHAAAGVQPEIGERHRDYLRRLFDAGVIPAAHGREEEWLEARVRERRQSQTPHEVRTKDGGWLLVADTPLSDGGLISTYTNVTQLKRAEQAKSLLQSTLVAANQAPDFEQALSACLATVCEHTGWPVGHALTLEENGSGPVIARDFWHLADEAKYGPFRQATAQARVTSNDDLPGQALAGGGPVWVVDIASMPGNARASAACACAMRSGCAFPVRSGGQVAAILEFFSDEPVEPQEQLLEVFGHLGDQLGNVLERRRADETFRQAQKMEAVGQLTGGLAHDFNNLLAVILGNLELVDDEPLDLDEARTALKRAARAAEKGAGLTSRLLAFSRRQPLRPVATDVNKLITGFVDLLHRTLGENLWIRTGLKDDLWPARVDRGQLETALLNLAINARDAMPLGGRLMIETDQCEISDRDRERRQTLAPGRYVTVAVADTGAGIAHDHLDKVFEPFFTTKETGAGSGLGLSMVYGFAKQSQGHVEIRSKQGLGTRVRLYLPAADATPATASSEIPDAPRGNGETILVVEDDADVRDLVTRALGDLGYRALAAASAKEGLRLLKDADGVALLLTDMILPEGMNGLDLAAHARARRPSLKAVLMSGYSDQLSGDPSSAHSDMPLLAKPFRKADLARVVRRALDEPARMP